MVFRKQITDQAFRDIDEATTFIGHDSPGAAAAWKEKLQDLINSLETMPARFPVIPEARDLNLPYRAAPHFSHRVIFRIDEPSKSVYVVPVYHGARQPLT